MGFKKWIIKEDIFGFEDREVIAPMPIKGADKPLRQFNVEDMMKTLAKRPLGAKNGRTLFPNEARWGLGSGSVRCWVQPNMGVVIDRYVETNGSPRWITKKVFQINRNGYGGHEEEVADSLYQFAQEIDKSPLDSPNGDFNEFEDLVIDITNKIRTTMHPIFIFEGVWKVSETDYIIQCSFRGAGAGSTDQKKAQDHHTRIQYNKDEGIIHLNDFILQSDNGHNQWEQAQSDTEFWFTPSQKADEIAEAIAVQLHFY